MKKIIKKSIAFVLAVMITLTSSSVYSAAEIPDAPETYVTEDGIEVDSSISSSEISDMPEAYKKMLLKEEGTLVSYTVEYIDIETNTKSRTTMPTSDFSLTIGVIRVDGSSWYGDNVARDCFKVLAMGNWYMDPFWEFTDCMAISWSDDFALYKSDAYQYFSVFQGKEDYEYRGDIRINKVDKKLGVAYDLPMTNIDKYETFFLEALICKNASSGVANVVVEYAHSIIGLSGIQVSFNNKQEITFSTGIVQLYEQASPAYTSFSY